MSSVVDQLGVTSVHLDLVHLNPVIIITSPNVTLALLTNSCLQVQLILMPYNFNGPFRSWCCTVAAYHGPGRHSDQRA